MKRCKSLSVTLHSMEFMQHLKEPSIVVNHKVAFVILTVSLPNLQILSPVKHGTLFFKNGNQCFVSLVTSTMTEFCINFHGEHSSVYCIFRNIISYKCSFVSAEMDIDTTSISDQVTETLRPLNLHTTISPP